MMKYDTAHGVITDDDGVVLFTVHSHSVAQQVMLAMSATLAEPIVKLLNEARRTHARGYNDEACDYPPCPKSYDEPTEEKCTCAADEWNARIDEALK